MNYNINKPSQLFEGIGLLVLVFVPVVYTLDAGNRMAHDAFRVLYLYAGAGHEAARRAPQIVQRPPRHIRQFGSEHFIGMPAWLC